MKASDKISEVEDSNKSESEAAPSPEPRTGHSHTPQAYSACILKARPDIQRASVSTLLDIYTTTHIPLAASATALLAYRLVVYGSLALTYFLLARDFPLVSSPPTLSLLLPPSYASSSHSFSKYVQIASSLFLSLSFSVCFSLSFSHFYFLFYVRP